MTTREQATAAPIEVDFGDGKKYKLSPMRDIDNGEFLGWVQSRFIQIAKDNTNDLSPEERALVIANVSMKAAVISETSPEFLQLAVTLAGLSKMLELSVQQHHPDVKADDLLRIMIKNPDIAEEASRVHRLLNTGSDTLPKKKRPTKKEVRKKRKKRKT